MADHPALRSDEWHVMRQTAQRGIERVNQIDVEGVSRQGEKSVTREQRMCDEVTMTK
jgi:hypothetical protein